MTDAATKKVAFGDRPLKDSELPTFLARAAMRAASKALTAREDKPDLTGSPGYTGTPKQKKQVEAMSALGLSNLEIARVLMIEVKLLEFYFGYELGTAKLRTNIAVAKKALEMALDGVHPDMTRFWLTHRASWKATTVVEHNGIDAAADEARSAREKLIGSGVVQEIARDGTAETNPVPIR